MSKEVTRYDLRVTDDGAGLYATDEPNTRGMQYVSALDYEALLAERDALKKDVERYRWLRENSTDPSAPAGVTIAICAPNHLGLAFGPGLDAAIDAALQGEQP